MSLLTRASDALAAGSPQALAVALWSNRARLEVISALRFARIARSLRRLDAPAALVSQAEQAAEDERRHTVLCQEMAESMGAAQVAQGSTASKAFAGELARAPLFIEIVAHACVGETCNVVYLNALLEAGAQGPTRAVTQALLRDEVSHAKFGWAALAFERTRGEVAFLAPHVGEMLTEMLAEEPFDPPGPSAALGLMSAAGRRRATGDAVRDVVLPGLLAMGVVVDIAGLRSLDQPG